MKICLSKFTWHNSGNVWVTGFIRSGATYLAKEQLLDYFSGIASISEFERALKSANGQFSVIILSSGEIWAATDRLRNWPVYYSCINGNFIISDDAYKLCELQPEKLFNETAVDSFQTAGFVVNNLTLINNVYQIEAGEYVIMGDSFSRKFYYDHAVSPIIENEFVTSANQLKNTISDVFQNHLKALSDKFIAIPLSGGFDSRLIAAMCSKYHPRNVLCYTYGTKDNPEVAPAKEVAGRLGLKWINIVYDSPLILNFRNDGFFNDYYPFASNLTSMFFMQEYFAVRYLKENKLVPDNCVFLSGFSGDMLAGSHLVPSMKFKMDNKRITKLIFEEYFGLTNLNKRKALDLMGLINKKTAVDYHETFRVIENWDQKERQAKFIVNSAKVFTFFGYDYVLPLWDNLLSDFFSRLPFRLKLDKKLYDHVLKEYIFRELDLNFSREINPLPYIKSYQRFKERFKGLLPYKVKNLLIDHKSPFLYDQISKDLLKDIDPRLQINPRQSNYYNSYIAQWYLFKTRTALNIKGNE